MRTDTSQRALELLLDAVSADPEFGSDLATTLRVLLESDDPPDAKTLIDTMGAADGRD